MSRSGRAAIMKIAVTGGSGRVGKGVLDLALAQGHQVVNIDRVVRPPADLAGRPNLTCVQADITDYEALVSALRGCDALIHLAAIPAPGSLPDHVVHNNNVTGSYNALRAAVEAGIQRICQASSVNATGLAYSRWPRFDYFPLDERTPPTAKTPMPSRSGSAKNRPARSPAATKSLTIASLRFHGVYPQRPGAWQTAAAYPDQ